MLIVASSKKIMMRINFLFCELIVIRIVYLSRLVLFFCIVILGSLTIKRNNFTFYMLTVFIVEIIVL